MNSGRYKNVSEVFSEALRLLEERDEMYLPRLADLRHAIELGLQGEPINAFPSVPQSH